MVSGKVPSAQSVRSGIRRGFNAALHPLTLLLLAFISNASLWATVTGIGHPPDEFSHFDYIRYVAINHTLPVAGVTRYIHTEGLQAHASAPPLYYLFGALLEVGLRSRSLVEQVLVIRGLSVLMGAMTVALIYLLGRLLVPKRPVFALALAVIVGFNPMFTYMSAAINSESLIDLICVAVFLALAWGLHQRQTSRKWLIGLGALLGAGLLTKQTILIEIVATTPVLLILAKRQHGRFLRTALNYGLYVGGVMMLIGLWNYVRNWILYRSFSGMIAGSRPDIYQTHPYRVVGSMWEMVFTSKGGYPALFPAALKSFWGVFDHMEIAMPSELYDIVGVIFFGGLIGTAVWIVRAYRTQEELVTRQRLLLAFVSALIIAFAIVGFLHLSYNIDVQPQGRYLFVALPPFALAMVGGWEQLLDLLRLKWLAAPMIVVLILLVNALALVYSLAPDHHDRYMRGIISAARGQLQESLTYAKDGRDVPGIVFPVTVALQSVREGAPALINFVPKHAEVESLGLLLDIPASAHGPLIWRLSSPRPGEPSLEADLQHPLAGFSHYDFDVSAYHFTPGQAYVLNVEAPSITSGQPVLAALSESVAHAIKAEPNLHITYRSIVSAEALQAFYDSLLSDAHDSLRGKLQRVLYPVSLLFLIALATIALAPLFSSWRQIAVSLSTLLAIIVALSPVPSEQAGSQSTFKILPGPTQPFESNAGVAILNQGFLDVADCNMISGWAWNANQPNVPIEVEVYDENRRLASISANVFRADLVTAGIGNGYHGFAYSFKDLRLIGTHPIGVRFAGTSTELTNAPRSITCGPAATSRNLSP